MANKKITQLTEDTDPSLVDVLPTVEDSSGGNRKVQLANLHKGMTPASLTVASVIELATIAETNAGTSDGLAVTPSGLDGWTGSTNITGLGTVVTGDVVTIIPASDPVTAGLIRTATTAGVDLGLDETSAITPKRLQESKRNIRYLVFSLIASDTDVAVDTTIGGDFTIPFSGTILQSDSLKNQLAATNDTAGITGTMVVDIHLNGATIMTTNKLDIETTEKSTVDAATQPDLTTTDITADDVLTFDIDAIHSGTAAKGLKVFMAIRED